MGEVSNVVSLNILVHDLINLLYYEHWTDKRKYFYVNKLDTENPGEISDGLICIKLFLQKKKKKIFKL